MMEKHLDHHWDTGLVESECGLTPWTKPVAVKRANLTHSPSKADCAACLRARRVWASREATECTERLEVLRSYLRTVSRG